MATTKTPKRRKTGRQVAPVVLPLPERLATELLAVGEDHSIKEWKCTRIAFKVSQPKKHNRLEIETGGLCYAALVQFFRARLPE